jgi:hypothetical protein
MVFGHLPAPGLEQTRAATSGRAAIQVVKAVEVRVPLEPNRRDWSSLLGELAAQLNDRRVYDRDLPGLANTGAGAAGLRRRARLTGPPPCTEADPPGLLQYWRQELDAPIRPGGSGLGVA